MHLTARIHHYPTITVEDIEPSSPTSHIAIRQGSDDVVFLSRHDIRSLIALLEAIR